MGSRLAFCFRRTGSPQCAHTSRMLQDSHCVRLVWLGPWNARLGAELCLSQKTKNSVFARGDCVGMCSCLIVRWSPHGTGGGGGTVLHDCTRYTHTSV